MKIKTSELTGGALNWAVTQAEGDKVFRPRLGRPSDWDKEAYLKDGSDDRWVVRVQNPKLAYFVDWTYNPSGDWMQGGPIIERERLSFCYNGFNGDATPPEKAYIGFIWNGHQHEDLAFGETPLIAAMRCYVASKLGDEVEVPDEL